MSGFSHFVNIEVFKDEPQTREEYKKNEGWLSDLYIDEKYAAYVEQFQPYRWHAKAANNRIISDGESYHNLTDLQETLHLFAGDDTTVYYTAMFGEDRGLNLLRYGVTDRNAQGDDSPEQADGE